ncbi:hypothetical protein CYMTET_42054 [Cymbomonas tetramitiformis]|nr:hypothetical protein CYMTET_42054 [Cymbomonas tetramitiformis]
MVTVSCGGPWFALTPKNEWPTEPSQLAELQKDFHEDPAIGDRRQELVFLGVGLKEAELRSALDSCLATPDEMAALSGGGAPARQASQQDPFAPWPKAVTMIEAAMQSIFQPAFSGGAATCLPCAPCKPGGGGNQQALPPLDSEPAPPSPAASRKAPAASVSTPSSSLQGALPSQASPPAGRMSPAPAALAPRGVQMVTKGAAEFKQALLGAQKAGEVMMAMWGEASDPTCQSLKPAIHRLTSRHRTTQFVQIDVAVSAMNQKLAVAMGVKAYPTFQLYKGSKRMAVVTGSEALDTVALEAAIAEHAPLQSATEPLAALSSGSVAADAAKEKATSQAAAAAVPDAEDASVYDPPPDKPLKGGVRRVIKGQKAVLYPKMPCLKCGCPWWQGEGWEAHCIRCGWDCETGGYDDDSQPLPAFKGRWKRYREYILKGKTAPWKGLKG